MSFYVDMKKAREEWEKLRDEMMKTCTEKTQVAQPPAHKHMTTIIYYTDDDIEITPPTDFVQCFENGIEYRGMVTRVEPAQDSKRKYKVTIEADPVPNTKGPHEPV